MSNDKFRTSAEMMLKESNEMFIEESSQHLKKVFEEIGDTQMTSREYTERVLLPLVAKSNSNVKQFAVALHLSSAHLQKD